MRQIVLYLFDPVKDSHNKRQYKVVISFSPRKRAYENHSLIYSRANKDQTFRSRDDEEAARTSSWAAEADAASVAVVGCVSGS